MNKYDYETSIYNDVRDYIVEHLQDLDYSELLYIDSDKSRFIEDMQEEMFTADRVTGNGSGSYTFNTWEAEENLCHNMDLLKEALEEFGCDITYLEKGAEACDVTIRCYLMPGILDDYVHSLEFYDYFKKKLIEKKKEEEEEED